MPLAVVRLLATLLLSLGAGFPHMGTAEDTLVSVKAKTETPPERGRNGRSPKHLAATTEPVTACHANQHLPSAATPFNSTWPFPTSHCRHLQQRHLCTLPTTSASQAEPNWRNQLRQSYQNIHWPTFGKEMAEQSWKIGRWLLLAFLLEALITLYVPQEAIASLLGEQNSVGRAVGRPRRCAPLPEQHECTAHRQRVCWRKGCSPVPPSPSSSPVPSPPCTRHDGRLGHRQPPHFCAVFGDWTDWGDGAGIFGQYYPVASSEWQVAGKLATCHSQPATNCFSQRKANIPKKMEARSCSTI